MIQFPENLMVRTFMQKDLMQKFLIYSLTIACMHIDQGIMLSISQCRYSMHVCIYTMNRLTEYKVCCFKQAHLAGILMNKEQPATDFFSLFNVQGNALVPEAKYQVSSFSHTFHFANCILDRQIKTECYKGCKSIL